MFIWHDFAEAREGLGGCRTAATIGMFDGLHLGHQAVIGTLVAAARRQSLTSLVVTFDQHPSLALAGDAPPLLMTAERRLAALGEHDVEAALVVRFDAVFASLGPAAFVREQLCGDLRARLAVVGHDFRFGTEGSGDAALLAAVGRECGLEVTRVPPTIVDGITVSSTAIRWALAAGNVETANRLLGQAFTVRGQVVRGTRRGHHLGFPTANLALEPGSLWPRYGVYLVRIDLGEAGIHHGVANVGVKPTFGPAYDPVLEVFLLDFHGDLYHSVLDVSFIGFVRPEVRFADAESLCAQIERDVALARAMIVAK